MNEPYGNYLLPGAATIFSVNPTTFQQNHTEKANIKKFQCRELYGFALKEAPETLENEYVKLKNSS